MQSRKARAAGLLAILLLSGLLPLAASNHLWHGLPFFGDPDPLPTTGNATVDAALAALDGLAKEGVDHYNELAGMTTEPQVPTVLFADSFEPGRRIGGWGEWDATDGSAGGWFRTGASALEGDLGYQWLDPSTGYYPIAVSTDLAAVTHSFLVSPRISLESLPVDADAGPTGVHTDLARTTTAATTVELTVDHRYHFATMPGVAGAISRDGGRIQVFQDDPPTPETIQAGGVVLSPMTSMQGDGSLHSPSAPDGACQAPASSQPCPFLDEDFAFTGVQAEPVREHFDLTRFAGRDIWIVVHAASLPTTARTTFFQSPAFFDADVPLRGWHLDNLRIEGPTYAHNIIIDEILAPAFQDPQTGGRIVSSEDGEPFRMLVVNHGQFTEVVDLGLELAGPDLARPCLPEAAQVRLRPGEAHEAAFACPDLADGESFTAGFTARAQESRTDARPQDNFVEVPVKALRGLRIASQPMVVEPRLGSTADVRQILLPLGNEGYSSERIDLSLRIGRRAVEGEGPVASLPWCPNCVDVTDPALGVVTYAGAVPAPQQTLVLPPDPHGLANRRTARWDIILNEPGEYVMRVTGSVGGDEFLQREASAGALLSPSVVFQDLKASEPVNTIVHPDSLPWQSIPLRDVPPPCHSDGTCPVTFWELPAFVTPQPTAISRTGLRGEVDLSALPELPPSTEIDRLEVTYLHTTWTSCEIRLANPDECPLSTNSGNAQFVRFTLPKAYSYTSTNPANADTAVTSLEQGRRVGEEVLQTIVGKRSTGSNTDPMFHTHPVNRYSYYDTQWIEESYTVDLGLTPQRMSLPAAVLERAALEFENSPPAACPTSSFTLRCPTWRVAYAQVVAVTDDGRRQTVLSTTGDPAAEVGFWKSEFYVGSSATVTPFTACAAQALTTDPSEHAAAGLRCPSWLRRSASSLQPAVSPWLRTSALPIAENQDVWTHANGNLFYSDDAHGLLVSPALAIPDNLPDPYLSIRHQFNFQRFPATSGLSGLDDGGMLMLRFMKDDTGTLEPDSPFLPVVLFADANGPQAKAHRFRGVDCDFYLAGSEAAACRGATLANRPMFEHEFSLKRVPLLDYRAVHYDRSAQLQRVLQDPTMISLGGGALNGMETGGSVANPASDPDSFAYRTVDLTKDCAGSCIVQFAFRVDTWPGRIQSSGTGSAFTIDRTAAKNTAHANADGKGEGWYIGEMTVLAEQARAHDLEVVDARLETGYNWTRLGLGPGTPAQAVLTVRNNGLFKETFASRAIEVRNATGSTTIPLPSDPSFAVEPGALATVTIPFTVPAVEGGYQIGASIDLLHPAEGRAGLFIKDEDADNDCAAFYPDGSFLVQCSLDSTPGLQVRANPRLALTMEVTPRAGLPDFPRRVEVRVDNTGNVVVENATLGLSVQPLSGGAPTSLEWTLRASPPPGSGASWTDLTLVDAEGRTAAPRSTLVLGERGDQVSQRYLLRAQATQGDLFASAQALADAFTNLYSDTFEEGDLSRDPVVAGAIPLESPDGLWSLAEGVDFDGEGDHAWLFGDLDSGRYPASADASLLLPPLDMSSISQASLSFAHRYDLERGYDGGLMEASLDGGGHWTALTPTAGYPQGLLSSNPLVPGNDPTLLARGFSGSSLPRAATAEGWAIDEFDLGQLPGVTTPIVVQRLSQESFSTFNIQHGTGADERVSFANSWALPAQGCPTGCWYRENLHLHDPATNPGREVDPQPLPANDPLVSDPDFWWTGTAQRQVGATAATTLPLAIEVPDVPGHQQRLTYWAWKDAAGSLSVTLVTPSGNLPITPTPLLADPETGWTRYAIALSTQAGQSIQVLFTYTESLAASVSAANRGAVLDDVRLEGFTVAGGLVQVSSSAPYTSGNAAWRPPSAVPPAGNPLLWRTVERTDDVAEAWTVAQREGRQGLPSQVWWMGGIDDLTGRYSYPPNARERLATPLLSLKGIGGDQASLQYWERYDIAAGDTRRILVQPLVPSLGGDVPGPWVELEEASAASRAKSSSDCTGAADWCLRQVDVSPYIGQSVRFAFELESDRLNPILPPSDSSLGYHWAVDEVAILAESFVGDRMLLRLRAGTDANLDEGAWAVDNLQLVGRVYGSNLALLPDQPPGDSKLPAGSALDLTGLVRNLGRELERDVFVSAQVKALNGGPLPAIEVLAPTETASGLAGPVNLALAGTVTSQGLRPDRVPFHVRAAIPPDAGLGAKYRITLSLVQRDARGELGPPAFDENLGDHERTWDFTVGLVKPTALLDDPDTPLLTNVSISEPALTSGTPVTFGFDLDNRGNVPASFTAFVQVLDVGSIGTGEEIQFTSHPLLADLDPGQREHLEVTWDEATGTDLQRVVVHLEAVEGGVPSVRLNKTVGHLLIDAKPIFFRDGFESDPLSRGWSAASMPHNMCSGGSTNVAATPLGQWRTTDEDAYDGSQAFLLGVTGEEAMAGATYPPRRDELLTGPKMDLRDLADLNRVAPGPLHPNLLIHYKGDLGPNDGLVAQGRQGSLLATLPFADGPAGVLTCNNPLADASVNKPLGGNNPQRGAIVRDTIAWRTAQFSLGGEVLVGQGANRASMLGNESQALIRFGSDPGGESSGILVDGITVSSYDVRASPATQHVVLRNGADKVQHLLVENRGAATDTYTIQQDPALGELPSIVQFEVLDPVVTLRPGESALVRLSLRVDPAIPRSLGPQTVGVQVASTEDPGRTVQAVLAIGQVLRTLLPDLDVRLKRPAGEPEGLGEGDATTFLATVQNRGGASRPAALVLLACPDLGETAATLASCSAAPHTPDPDDDPIIILESGRIPALDPGGQSVLTLNWVPPRGSAGEYVVAAIADPGRVNRQGNTANDIALLPISILPSQQPDLEVESLTILDDSGSPVQRGFAGQSFTVTATFRNVGSRDATEVQLRLLSRFPLVEERLPRMGPDQVATLTTRMTVEAGNLVVLAEASTPTAESRSDNNVLKAPLAVLRGTILASFAPDVVAAGPGQDIDVVLNLHNLRDRGLEARLEPVTPTDVVLAGLPETIDLGKGARRELGAVVSLSPFLQDDVDVAVRVVDNTTGQRLAVAIVHVVAAVGRDIRVAADPLAAPPGLTTASLLVTNRGASPATVSLQPRGPNGWSVAMVGAPVRLAAGESAAAALAIEIPVGTAPGVYHIEIQDAGQTLAKVPFSVTAAPSFRSEVAQVVRSGGITEVWVRIKNIGNAAGIPPLEIAGAEGALSTIDPLPHALEPGAGAVFHVSVEGTGNGTLQVPGAEAVPLQAVEGVPSLQASGWAVDVAGQPRAGQPVPLAVTVRNAGLRPIEDVPVRAFQDGVLVAERRVRVEPGEETRVELLVPAEAGTHVVGLSVGSGDDLELRTALVEARPAERDAPGAGAALSALAILGLACFRRRRRGAP